ncbi:myelin-associated glycoprotein-like isoform X1 [Oncorhynchus masou masou]|uniref:myelin-associated glycoprotein-like isoform X1 n=1 Tax=Oncorhynchus masou masou TaxID=90313 RepID=UPI0031830CAF
MHITGAERLILIGGLLQGVLCLDFAALMPQNIKALSGSCVNIPCSFTLQSRYESFLTTSCKGIWRKGWTGVQVFDSSLTGTGLNTIQGNLTGNMQQKECTTILNDLTSYLNDYFSFRIDCDHVLRYNFPEYVTIDVKENPSKPTLSPATVNVMEGTSVSLICSAAAPCPSLPPTLTWTPTLSDSVEDLQVTPNRVITSLLNFTASHVHHGEKISCTALYKRQAGKSDKSSKTDLTVAVLYSPKNTSVSVSPSGSVVEGSSVTLTCSSNANPAVWRYNWYRVIGEQVSTVRASRMLTFHVPADYSYFYCEAINDHGTKNSSVIQLNGMYPPKNTLLSVSPSSSVVEGSSVTLTCNSNANPAVKNYTWYRVNGTEAVLLGSGESFTLDSKASDSGEYGCEALHALGKEKATVVQLDIQYPPKNTSLSVSPSSSVAEGSSVTLTCSSNANPAVKNYTWYRVEGREKNIVGSEEDLNISSVARLSNEQYYCEAQNVHGLQTSEAISIDVTFASEILNTSHCIRISAASQIRCFCDSYGNPAPTLVWQLAGESVNHSTNTIIREEPMGRAGLRSSLTIHQSQEEKIRSLVCLSSNSVAFNSFSFDLTSMKTSEGFHLPSLLIGAGVGAGVMMLLCIPLLHFCKHRRARQSPNKRQKDTADFIVMDETLFQEEDNVYANKAMLDEALGPNRTVDREIDDTDLLHYANLNFSKLQAKVAERGVGEGEIRGVASKTTEYAVIRLHSTGSIEGGAEKKEAIPALEQGEHAEDHGAKVLEESQAGHESDEEEEVAKDSALPELQGMTNYALSVQEYTEAPLGQSEQHNTAETAVDEVTLLSAPKDSSNGEEEETYGNICRGQVISEANCGQPELDRRKSRRV